MQDVRSCRIVCFLVLGSSSDDTAEPLVAEKLDGLASQARERARPCAGTMRKSWRYKELSEGIWFMIPAADLGLFVLQLARHVYKGLTE